MNLTKILKPLAQKAVDAALPAIRAELRGAVMQAVKNAKLPPALETDVLTRVVVALDGWTITL